MGANKTYYDVKAISATSLKWIETSPKYFKQMLNKEIEQKTLSWLEKGKQIHMYLLEPNEFHKNYIHIDVDTPKSPQQQQFCEDFIKSIKKTVEERAIDAYIKNYKTEKLSDDSIKESAVVLKNNLSKYITYLKKRTEYKDILTKSMWRLLKDIDECTRKHTAANNILYLEQRYPEGNLPIGIEVYNEYEIFWKYPNELDCKSAIDKLIVNHNDRIISLVDLKTTSDLSNFKSSFDDYKYYRQLAFYWMAIFYHFKNIGVDVTSYKYDTKIVAIQTTGIVECKVFNIKEIDLQQGLHEIEAIMTLLKWHYDNDSWEYSKSYYNNNGIEDL